MGLSSKEPEPATHVNMKRAGVRKKSETAMGLAVDGDDEVPAVRSGSLSPGPRASRRNRVL